MRRALVPRSLLPMRDTERASIRLPCGAAVTRMTTSSLKPKNGVVAVSSLDYAPADGPMNTMPASAQASQSPSCATISSVARAQVQCAIGSGHPRQVHVTGVRGPLQYGQGDGVGAANIGPTILHRAPRRHPP